MYSAIPLGLRLSRLFNKHSRHFAVRHLSLVAVLLLAVATVFVFVTRSRALTNVAVTKANESVAHTRAGAMVALLPATTIVVNSTADTAADDGRCTLREAITSANSDTASGAAGNECAAGSGADMITFDSAVFAASSPHLISLLSALPSIASDMDIQGPGAKVLTVERNSGAATRFRIFTTASFGPVTISGMTITKGFTADGPNGTVNPQGTPGGGIGNGGLLTLSDVAVSGNTTGKGGTGSDGSGGAGGSGGGILNQGILTVTNSTISGNQTGNGGNTVVAMPNASGGSGGGIANVGELTVTNSTISGNQTGAPGTGGTGSGSDGPGGGIFQIQFNPLTISNSTITANNAGSGNGGGIQKSALGSGIITLKSTIVGGNTAAVGPDIDGTVQSDGFNLIQDPSGATINQNPSASPNITGVSPLLGPLQNNGGPTQTHALLLGSPAIDKGKSFGLTTDQRGQTRPFDDPSIAPATDGINPPGDNSDIGAYEYQGSLVVTNTNDSGTGSLRAALAGIGPGGTVTFSNSTAGGAVNFFDGTPHTITLTSGEVLIDRSLTLTGPGANLLTVSGNNADRIFETIGGLTISINSLTIANGKVSTGTNGGAISIPTTTTMTINDSILSGNSTSGTGTADQGGAIYNFGTMTINNSTLSGNSATITSLGIFSLGGAIYNGGTLTINNSTLSGNSATGSSNNWGGAICNNGTLTLNNSTLSGNSATGGNNEGGGIKNFDTVNARNTIIAKNTAASGPDVSGALTSQGHNLIGDATGATGAPTTGDQFGTSASPIDPLLGLLAGNGGPTQTMAPLPGSPAIDAGDDCVFDNSCSPALATDQRGVTRKAGSHVDIGAVEVSYSINATAGTPQSATIGTPFATLLKATVTNAGYPASGVTVTFTAPASGASGTFQGTGTNTATAITDSNGVATAPVFTANSITGSYSVTASIGTGLPTAGFNLTNAPPPTLGNYPNTSVGLGASANITPDAAPTNTTGINVSTSTNFKGVLSANSATGVVSVTNASPAGAFTVKVTAFNSTGGTTSKTFQLTVQPGTACAGVPTFNNAADVNIGAKQVAAAVGDFNNDGKQDIATVDQGNIVSIRLGDGMGGFTGSTNVSVGLNPQSSLAIGDFNSDGNQDFATANLNANTVSIRLGDGVGGFTGSTEVSAGNGPTRVAVGDFNNDGKQDLAVAHLNSPSGVSIRLGDGAGGFTGSTNITVGFSVLWVAIGDFNNDGKQDIATANPDSDNVSIRLGDGTGAFTGSTNIGVGDRPTTVTIGDFNNDGKQDLAAANSFSDDVSIRLGDGTGGFTGSTNIGVGDFPLSVAVGDFNNDGKQDFAADNFDSNTVSIRLGDGLGAFTGSTNISVGSSPYPIAIGDFNNDGKQDFVAPSGDLNTASVRLGGCNLTPAITAAPGLSRQQGSPASNSQIATVTDDGGNGSVIVTVTSANPSNGVSISNIVNTSGAITADIVANCTASNASFTLQASDGASTSTATLNITVTANTAPTLSYTNPPAVNFNGSTTVTPATATDNGSITGYSVQSVVPALTTPPTVDSSGVVSITNAQPAGTHTITIRATDNCGLTADASFTLTANKANTATALASSVNPSDFGQSVTFTATVTSGAGTPTGTVQFKDNGNNLGAPVALNAGVAQFTTSTLASGNHPITADYNGDTNFATSTGTLSGGQVVKAQPTLSINDVSIAEGDTGASALSFTVTLSSASNLTATVDFATANGTAIPPDYLATNGTLTFNPGDLTKTISVTINGDVNFEPNETFTVNLTNAVNAGISKATGTGTIQNDDPAGGVIAMNKTEDTVSEATGFITVTVVRTKDVSQAVNVDYATDDTGASTNCGALNTSLASSRCDYSLMLGTLKFAANETQKTVDIPINRDGHLEGAETFKFVLSNPTGAILAAASSLNITINDSVVPSANAIDDTDLFVRQQYHDFLNREPDAAGLAFWKDNIDKCMDATRIPAGQTAAQCLENQRIITSAAFFLSIEFRQTGGLVRDFYVASLDRPATNNMPNLIEFTRDTQAIQKSVVVREGNWQAQLAANQMAFMADFVTRPEFAGLYPTTDTPAQYVDKLYLHANVTPGSAQERNDAIAEFGGAATASNAGARGRALLRITQNVAFQAREINRAFVQMEYFGYLRRNPNDPPDNNFNGYNFWLAKLNQFNGDFLKAEMVKAFLSSDEYRRRFGP